MFIHVFMDCVFAQLYPISGQKYPHLPVSECFVVVIKDIFDPLIYSFALSVIISFCVFKIIIITVQAYAQTRAEPSEPEMVFIVVYKSIYR